MGHWIDEAYRKTEQHEELADRLARAERGGDVGLAARLRRGIAYLLNMEWLDAFYEGYEVTPQSMKLMRDGIVPVAGAAFGPKEPRRGNRVLDDYAATFSAAVDKKHWVHDSPCDLVGVRFNTGASDRTTGSDVSDVNRNGTTIFTTQANRPTQPAATIGDWTVGFPDGVKTNVAGDTASWDGDTASTGGTGKTKVTLALAYRLS